VTASLLLHFINATVCDCELHFHHFGLIRIYSQSTEAATSSKHQVFGCTLCGW